MANEESTLQKQQLILAVLLFSSKNAVMVKNTLSLESWAVILGYLH